MDINHNIPRVNPNVIANVFRVYQESLFSDDDFMLGWRSWSFYMTKKDRSGSFIEYDEYELIQRMKLKGQLIKCNTQKEWSRIRSWILTSIITINPSLSLRDKYRYVFKHVAFVLVDCCFVVKYKLDAAEIRKLLVEMFCRTGTREVPSYFIILDNGINESEFYHKMNQCDRKQYLNTQQGILEYQQFQPNICDDGIARMDVPLNMVHDAMIRSEHNVRDLCTRVSFMTTKKFTPPSRARINDHAQLYLMDRFRRSFGRCARVALLSDDYVFTKIAAEFAAPQSAVSVNKDIPDDYIAPYFVTPYLLSRTQWTTWRKAHVRVGFAKQFEHPSYS